MHANEIITFIFIYIFLFRLFVLGLVGYCCCAVFYTNRRCAIDSRLDGCVCVRCLGLLCVAVVVNKYQLIVIWDYDAVDMAGFWLTDWRPRFLLFFSPLFFFFRVCFYLKNYYHFVGIVFERCRRHHCCCCSSSLRGCCNHSTTNKINEEKNKKTKSSQLFGGVHYFY